MDHDFLSGAPSSKSCPLAPTELTTIASVSPRPWRSMSRHAASSVLRRGPRTVITTNESMRLGNLLYLWLRAHASQAEGRDVRVQHNAASNAWLPILGPELEQLTLVRDGARLWDRLEDPPPEHFQVFGRDFSPEQLRAFIREVVLSQTFCSYLPRRADDALTINVRRGDYYSVPEYRARYGFEVQAYLRSALVEASHEGSIGIIHVVSDDPEWCHSNLGWMWDFAPVVAEPMNAVSNLAALGASPRLILANSTFSYWGGYLSGVIHERTEGKSSVWVPDLHVRDINAGHAWQIDPCWRAVPSSWAS